MMERRGSFEILAVAPFRTGERFRVYPGPEEVYLIREERPGMAHVAGAQFGALGAVIGAHLQERAERRAADDRGWDEFKTFDELLRDDPRNRRIRRADVSRSLLAAPTFWQGFAYPGYHFGLWSLEFADRNRLCLGFATPDALRSALDALPAVFGSALDVRLAWDAQAKEFRRRAAGG